MYKIKSFISFCVKQNEPVYKQLPWIHMILFFTAFLLATSSGVTFLISGIIVTVIIVIAIFSGLYTQLMDRLETVYTGKRYKSWIFSMLWMPYGSVISASIFLVLAGYGTGRVVAFGFCSLVILLAYEISCRWLFLLFVSKWHIRQALAMYRINSIVADFISGPNGVFLINHIEPSLLKLHSQKTHALIGALEPSRLQNLDESLDFDLLQPDEIDDDIMGSFFDHEVVFCCASYRYIYLEALLILSVSGNWPTEKEVVISVDRIDYNLINFRIFYRTDYGRPNIEKPEKDPIQNFCTV